MASQHLAASQGWQDARQQVMDARRQRQALSEMARSRRLKQAPLSHMKLLQRAGDGRGKHDSGGRSGSGGGDSRGSGGGSGGGGGGGDEGFSEGRGGGDAIYPIVAALFSGGGALSMRLWRWNLGRFWSACELVALGPALAAMTAVTGTACVAGGAALIAGATWHDWWRWWGRGPPGDGPPGSQRQTPPDAQQQQQEQEQQPRLRRWQRWWQQVWQWPPHRATYAAGAAVAGAVMPLISWLDEHGDELEAQLQQAVVAA
eukprot:CAMPEP_0206150280 /NCGR_PEP_ID=MMETSP1473-20131121/38216_1 /ASSEMBLY_ACC=CAM_ASM_001109 /TAXON_ID=1461547 /ORGANISM="Stichococcus sp, Strain RCC1054" /LENGTH=258 /DNA_ID=CAMNT_0053547775 /DNA_START=1341 /DNA_END=2117 /DNA_ORIENTATION=-